MTVKVTKPAVNLREKLAELDKPLAPRYQQFRFTGDASTTEFSLANGWTAFAVYDTSGALMLEGSSDDYTVSNETVTFAVAPSAADFVIIGVLEL